MRGGFMGFKHMIAKYFNNHAETSETHWDESLRTHYYKTTKEKGLQAAENFFKNTPIYKINAISNEHGELSVSVVKGRKAFIVVTVIMVKPYQTAIDIAATTESGFPFDFSYSTKLIQRIYNEFDKQLPLMDKAR